MPSNEKLHDILQEIASYIFYGKPYLPAEYFNAVARMEAHPEYPALRARLDAANEAAGKAAP